MGWLDKKFSNVKVLSDMKKKIVMLTWNDQFKAEHLKVFPLTGTSTSKSCPSSMATEHMTPFFVYFGPAFVLATGFFGSVLLLFKVGFSEPFSFSVDKSPSFEVGVS